MERARSYLKADSWDGLEALQSLARRQPVELDLPPPFSWREEVGALVSQAEQDLFKSNVASMELIARQITPEAARHYHLGYSGRWIELEHARWWAKGIVVPYFSAGLLWACKIRVNRPGLKYFKLPGSRDILFGYEPEPASDTLILVESELDAVTAKSAVPEADCWALGGTGNLGQFLALTNQARRYPTRILCLDNDTAGRDAALTVLAAIPMLDRVALGHKDLGDMAKAGQSIRSFLLGGMSL